jgi:WD40 repeat protein
VFVLQTLTGHTGFLWSVEWSPDGRYLASVSGDHTIRMWDTETWQLLWVRRSSSEVTSLTWSPDSEYVAYPDSNHIFVSRARSGGPVTVLMGHTGRVLSLAWSPDGRYIASSSVGRAIRIWEMPAGNLKRTLEGHTKTVGSVAWSPDGRYLASASADGTVRIWGTSTGQLLQTLTGHNDWVSSVAWSPDGRFLASGGSSVIVWEAASWQRAWDTAFSYYNEPKVAWSPDGRYLASGARARVRIGKEGADVVQIRDRETGQILWTLGEHYRNGVFSVAWSPDGRYLASGADDGTIRIWGIR